MRSRDMAVFATLVGGGAGCGGAHRAPTTRRVHFVIDNRRGQALAYAVRYADGAGGGGDAPPGATRVVWPAPIGQTEVFCYDRHGPADLSALHGAVVTVIDPNRLLTSPALQCSGRAAFTE